MTLYLRVREDPFRYMKSKSTIPVRKELGCFCDAAGRGKVGHSTKLLRGIRPLEANGGSKEEGLQKRFKYIDVSAAMSELRGPAKRVFFTADCPKGLKRELGQPTNVSWDDLAIIPIEPRLVCGCRYHDLALFCVPNGLTLGVMQDHIPDIVFYNQSGLSGHHGEHEHLKGQRRRDWNWHAFRRGGVNLDKHKRHSPDVLSPDPFSLAALVYINHVYRKETGANFFTSAQVSYVADHDHHVVIDFSGSSQGAVRIFNPAYVERSSVYACGSILEP